MKADGTNGKCAAATIKSLCDAATEAGAGKPARRLNAHLNAANVCMFTAVAANACVWTATPATTVKVAEGAWGPTGASIAVVAVGALLATVLA